MVVSSLVDFDKNGVGDMFVDDTGEPGWVVTNRSSRTSRTRSPISFVKSCHPSQSSSASPSSIETMGYCFAHCPYNATRSAALRVGPPDLWEP